MPKIGKTELPRINIRVSKKIKTYFENKSVETGVSQSALMALALEEYIDQKNMLILTKKLNDLDCENS
ncbi:MAG: hypothetical protein ACRDDY_13075 [Clostridium sp.]|uniref:hypothetical protein n=1 Tax=Clostridium sp. TaxID=1506 RepID=UPI003EE51B5A